MRLFKFENNGSYSFGIIDGNQALNLAVAAPSIANNLSYLLSQEAITYLKSLFANKSALINIASLNLLLPIAATSKIIGVGLNYRDHAIETKKEIPTYPVLFARYFSSICGPREELIAPICSSKYDYEGELAVIIGKQAKNVKESEAHLYIGGYSIFNDGTVRDYQAKSSQWLLGKNFDKTASLGPVITLTDEIKIDEPLAIKTCLNGQIMQDSNSSNMIFSISKLIACITEAITLEAGDVIVTGTPAGVGYTKTPPVYLKKGDLCEIEIEKIGVLSNYIK